jgi:DNA-binding CsgD family transcriptional regulator
MSSVADLIGQIKRATSAGQLQLIMRDLNAIFKIDGSVFASFAREDDSSDESYKYIIACDQSWCDLYNRNRWFRSDPCLTYAQIHTEPIPIESIPLRTEDQKDMMAAARYAGFASGIVIPVHSSLGRSRMGVLYAGSRNDQLFCEEDVVIGQMVLRGIALDLLDWLIRKSREELIGAVRLKEDEVRLLKLTHENLSSKQIAYELGISKAAIDKSLCRITLRFNACSRIHAAKIAFEAGLFQ